LTVTDNTGATSTISHSITTTDPAPANQDPTAAFTSDVTNLEASFDATSSSDPDGSITSYDWDFGDTTTATGATTSHTYTTAGDHTVTLTVTDNTGATSTISHSITTTDPAPAATTLIAMGDIWRYSDVGAVPSGWLLPAFDDSSWRTGAAQLGYGDGDEATVIPNGDASGRFLTSYFRKEFTWDGSHPVNTMTLGILADDSAAVYLNGVEIARDNLPAGPITFNTYALSGRWGPTEQEVREFDVSTAPLQVGRNVLAVEVHQDYRNSSDASLDIWLNAAWN
ncbi:MAG: PKD domain-containing protein, partial [Actinobacteria bacterium]|nr:PKD domain-containing protein [Actinomycetota bacterium]